MTNEEEKILEEEEVTLEEAAEEAEELQEETQDEGHAIEIPVERREDANIEEILERQVLRDGGLRDAGHPEMIQTHLDNFLAKIAGETPIDYNPRNSTEFWLNEIAENLPGGGTTVIANPTLAGTEDALTGLQVGETKYKVGEKLYIHNVFAKSDSVVMGFCIRVITTVGTPFNTVGDLGSALIDIGVIGSTKMIPATGGYVDYTASNQRFIAIACGAYARANNDARVSIYGVNLNNDSPIFGEITTFALGASITDFVQEI